MANWISVDQLVTEDFKVADYEIETNENNMVFGFIKFKSSTGLTFSFDFYSYAKDADLKDITANELYIDPDCSDYDLQGAALLDDEIFERQGLTVEPELWEFERAMERLAGTLNWEQYIISKLEENALCGLEEAA